MEIRIGKKSEISVRQQLAEQIIFSIATDKLRCEGMSSEAWPCAPCEGCKLRRGDHPLRFAKADPRVKRMRFGAVLSSTIFLARRLRKEWEGQRMVGILLPPSAAGAMVNFAALLQARCP